jgi:hypothetical protein
MPLFSDVIQYDISARIVLKGGVAYRDVADLNLPGMVWLHVVVRSPLGWSSEALRLVDFLVVSGIVALLLHWLRLLGLSAASRVWTAVMLFAFYFSTSEWVHCQRDTWMLLPSLLALALRRRQLDALLTSAPQPRLLAGRAFLEGVCWGAAFWIKPFVAVPGLACWILCAVLVNRAALTGTFRRLALDALGLIGGGLLVGALGVLWLVQSGAWPYFWHIMTGVNRDYYANSRAFSLGTRLLLVLSQFYPWDCVYIASVPLALLALWSALSAASPSGSFPLPLARRALLGVFFLGWWAQASFLQVPHAYVLAPSILIGCTVLVGLAFRLRSVWVGWLLLLAFVVLAAAYHPLLHGPRLSLWSRCWREGSSADLRNRLQLTHMTHTPDWVRLNEVAEYLRRQGLEDRELTVFSPSATSLYLDLDLQPSTPGLHFELLYTAFHSHTEEVREQLNASPQRFVVSDIRFPFLVAGKPWQEPRDPPPALPADFPADWAQSFPWSEPIVFRSGFYLVHRVTGPVQRLQ